MDSTKESGSFHRLVRPSLPKTQKQLERIIYRALTVQLLRLRKEVFQMGGMDRDTFDATYLDGIGAYERRVAKQEGIPINDQNILPPQHASNTCGTPVPEPF